MKAGANNNGAITANIYILIGWKMEWLDSWNANIHILIGWKLEWLDSWI